MQLTKRLMKQRPVQAFLAWAASLYIRLLRASIRWEVVENPASAAVVGSGRGVIGCFWHGSMLLVMPLQPRGRDVYVLISGHRDGLFISRGIEHLGIKTVAGSSRRGGSLALRAMARLLARNQIVLITPDGPRGPLMRAKPGAIKAAQLTGAPIVPLGAAVTRARVLSSWDRFCLPYPFVRGVILWGDPIAVPRHAEAADLERLRRKLEESLNRLTAEARQRCGQPQIEPGRPGLSADGDEPGHARP